MTRLTPIAAAAAAAVAAWPLVAASQPPPADGAELGDDDLADIEQALADDAAAGEDEPAGGRASGGVIGALQSLNPDISLITDVAVAYFSADNLQTGGHDPSESGFTLQQLEMAVGGAVDPYFRVDGNLVFSQFGVEIEEIYGTTLALPGNLQARVGQFLTRFGRLNATHPHAWDFVDQPFQLGRVFGGEGNRGVGAELSYLTRLPWYAEVVVSFSEAAGEATARSFFGPDDLPLETPLDVQSTVALEQFFELGHDWSLLTGLSVATGPNPTGYRNRSDVYGVDLFFKYRPISRVSETRLELQAEWLYRRRQIPGTVLRDHGGYAYLLWQFATRWETAARYEYGAAATTRAGEVGADYLDPEWTAGRHRLSGQVTFHPTEFSRLRAQLSVDRPRWLDDPIVAAFLAVELAIGAHGAHRF
jgi:hypothetical protein